MVEPIVLDAGPTRYGFLIRAGEPLRQTGFGPGVERGELAFAPQLYPLAYPTFGEDPFDAPALRVTNASGVLSTRLVCTGHERSEAHDSTDLVIELRDETQPLTVHLHATAHRRYGTIDQWIEVTNDQSAPITLHEVAAANPVLVGPDPWLDHYSGDWGAEFTPVHDRLTVGTKILESRATTRPAHETAPFVRFHPDGIATETDGTVLAGTIAWGGNIRIGFEVARHNRIRAWFGHLPVGADYVLEPGATFTTPAVTWAWSDHGTRAATQRFHDWFRGEVLRDGAMDRPIVVNNWEATGFDFDAKRLERFCAETAQVAGEVFLLDDGWFADAYPRNDDNAGLGDWEPNRAKLPDGLSGVGRDAAAAGVRFGIWVEPEMVNPESRLYHDHPDWVVAEVGRERRTERNQLQLDLCRPEVADHVVDVLDGVLEPDNGVSYVKWDANRMVTEPGSGALPADRQGNWPVDVVRATWAAMDRVVAAHPSTQLMLCASGGGRIDPGTLSRFHEVWLSDNTDPVDRVRMQWHAATFIPTEALAAHVTRWGDRPVAFACAVAMSARFGFDVNRDALSDEDWDVCRRASAQYRLIRPLVQHGNLIRLVSPEYGSSAALAFVDTDGLDAVVFAYRLPTRETDVEPMPDHITIPGLDATRTYVIESIELTGDPGPDATTATGETLRTNGLSWTTTEACTASMWRVTAS